MPRTVIHIQHFSDIPGISDTQKEFHIPTGDASRYVCNVLGSALNSQGIVNTVENNHNSLEYAENEHVRMMKEQNQGQKGRGWRNLAPFYMLTDDWIDTFLAELATFLTAVNGGKDSIYAAVASGKMKQMLDDAREYYSEKYTERHEKEVEQIVIHEDLQRQMEEMKRKYGLK